MYSHCFLLELPSNLQRNTQISSSSSKFTPRFSINWFLPKPILVAMAEKWWFPSSSTMSTFTSWHSAFYCKQGLPSLSFRDNGYGFMDSSFISQWFVIHYSTQLLSCSCCPRLDQRPPWAGCLCQFLSTSLLSFSRLILCPSYPLSGISHLSKEPWLFLVENGIRNKYLSARRAHCF